MPITPLPTETVRLLGSSAVIVTPVDLVKELLDNAIDANAGTVAVVISPNTVDKIEVRDNGDGIDSDDYNALGRPGHTSKITSFHELQTIGGTTLGFRGQALASANALGTVTVTTRTAQDSTAVMLKLLPGVGGPESQQRASAPVGTTVVVSGLFGQMPVREQFAVKEAQKSLAKISRLLHSYALARPQIRLSFRVSGGKNKRSWLYSPAQGATIKEAVYQVFGNEVMSHSIIRTICSHADCEDGDTTQVEETLAIEAMLPKPGADQSKISSKISKASFFSIDSRPVSTQRGTMKKIQSMFKNHYSRSLGPADVQKTWKDPCICVNITCSPGTYDVNIEPSKNIVLFARESLLTSLFERLLSEVYSQESSTPFVTVEKRQLLRREQTRTPPPSSSCTVGSELTPSGLIESSHDQAHQMGQGLVQSRPHPVHELQNASCLSLNPVDGLDSEAAVEAVQNVLINPSVVPVSEQEAGIDHSTIKIVDAGPRKDQFSMLSTAANARTTGPAREPRRRHPPAKVGSRRFVVNMSTDPDMSSDEEAEMLASRFRGQQDADLQEQAEVAVPREVLNPWSIAKLTAPARQPGAGNILPQDNSHSPGHIYEPHNASVQDDAFDDNLPILRPYGEVPVDLGPLRPARLGISHAIEQLPGLQHTNPPDFHTDAIPVVHDEQELPNLRFEQSDARGDVEPGGLMQTRLAFGGQRGSEKRRGDQVQLHIDNIPSRSNPPYRKPKRVNNGRKGSPAVNTPGNLNNPVAGVLGSPRLVQYEIGQTRHQSTQQTVQGFGVNSGDSRNHSQERPVTPSSNQLPVNDKWFGGDSRRYLIRRQRSEAEHQRKGRQPLKRAKSDTLPLEKVPEKEMIQHLVLTIVPDTKELGRVWEATTGVDTFCSDCRTEIDLCDNMNLDDITDIEERLRIVLASWTEKILGQKAEVGLDIRSQVERKALAA